MGRRLELKVTKSLVMLDPRVMGKNELKEQNLMSRSGGNKFQVKVKQSEMFPFLPYKLTSR